MSDTITLADGTVISTRTGSPVRATDGTPAGYVAIPTHTEAQKEVTRVRRRISDLPETPERMHVIGVVAAYYLFGLDDREIALAIGCTEQQVGNIKMTPAYTTLIESMQASIVESAQDDVRGFLAMKATRAAQRMSAHMESDDEAVSIAASKDILDRSGHRPADVVEHRHSVEGGLTIEYVRKSTDAGEVTLDLEVDK